MYDCKYFEIALVFVLSVKHGCCLRQYIDCQCAYLKINDFIIFILIISHENKNFRISAGRSGDFFFCL